MDLSALRGPSKPPKYRSKMWIPWYKKYKWCFSYGKEGHSRANYKELLAKKEDSEIKKKEKEGKDNNY
jgi:hypothetical protein